MPIQDPITMVRNLQCSDWPTLEHMPVPEAWVKSVPPKAGRQMGEGRIKLGVGGRSKCSYERETKILGREQLMSTER